MHFACGAVPAAAVHWDGAAVPVWAGSAAGHSAPVGEHLAAAADGRHSAGAAVPAGDTPAAVRRCEKHIRRPAAAGSRSGVSLLAVAVLGVPLLSVAILGVPLLSVAVLGVPLLSVAILGISLLAVAVLGISLLAVAVLGYPCWP